MSGLRPQVSIICYYYTDDPRGPCSSVCVSTDLGPGTPCCLDSTVETVIGVLLVPRRVRWRGDWSSLDSCHSSGYWKDYHRGFIPSLSRVFTPPKVEDGTLWMTMFSQLFCLGQRFSLVGLLRETTGKPPTLNSSVIRGRFFTRTSTFLNT